MASLGESVQKGLEELEKEITCSVCHDSYQEPKILPCCHYYCKMCIQSLAQTAGVNQPFPCPECRNETLLPHGDPDRLPTAFFVNRLKELYSKMEKASGKVEAQCEMCSGGHVTAFCRQCTYFICSECVSSHQKMKVFVGHIVTTIDELKRGGANQFLAQQPSSAVCPDHDVKLNMFCLDCRQTICRDCIIVDHSGHSYDFVKKMSPVIKETISNRLSTLKDINRSICEAILEVKINKEDIQAQRDFTSRTIEERVSELHKVLDEHKYLLLKDTSHVAEYKLEELSVQEQSLRKTSARIQGIVDSIGHSIDNCTDEELLSLHKHVLGCIDEAISKHSETDSLQLEPVEEADIRLDLNISAESFKRQLQSHAQVKHTSADPEKCVVESESCLFKEKMTMRLIPYLPNSKPTVKYQSVEVCVKSKADRLAFQVSPEQMPDNSYKIEFTPRIRGRHEVTIAINDEKVSGSPFLLMVDIPPNLLGNPIRVIGGIKKPWGVAINSKGELIVTEHDGNVLFLNRFGALIREIKRRDHKFEFLSGVAVDGEDNVYVVDYSLNTLFKFDQNGKLMKKIGGRKGCGPGEFNKPRGLTFAKGQLYVCDYDNNRVQVLTSELYFVKEILPFSEVRDISVDPSSGHLYVCDTGNNRIQVFNEQEELSFLINAKDKRDLIGPCGICVANNYVYVVENPLYKEENVSVFTKKGIFVTSFGELGKNAGQFRNPYGITVDKDGFLYVCDYGNSRIQIF